MNQTDMTVNRAPVLLRGCGERKRGGIYAECGLSPWGVPIEHFLVDPPQVVDAGALGLASIGVKLIEMHGALHVFDIVGAEHYPNVADFVEEVRVMGASRRLAKTLDFAKLTADSKLVLLHRRAHIDNAGDSFASLGTWPPPGWQCPKRLPEHQQPGSPPAMCAGLWWTDVDGGVPCTQWDAGHRHATPSLSGPHEGAPLQAVTRRMPAFAYDAWQRPAGLHRSTAWLFS